MSERPEKTDRFDAILGVQDDGQFITGGAKGPKELVLLPYSEVGSEDSLQPVDGR